MLFIQDSAYFSLHSTDADTRRVSGDTSMFAESPRHFIDIDDYPNYQNLTRSFDTLVMQYGWERVKRNGINPWTTVWFYDSLVAQLRRGDWTRAKLTASDIGHYTGDAHQPLHVTINYNGQLTGNTGIHSRYESTMLSSSYYLSSLYINADSVTYASDKINFVFDYILHALTLVDTVLRADTYAKQVSGWTGTYTAAYYAALWERTRTITLDQMQRGTKAVASLWYSAWVDAGLIVPNGVLPDVGLTPAEFSLHQNYPNPFNPRTTISFTLPVGGTISLKLYSVDGKQVGTLCEGNYSAGSHQVELDASSLSSGVYFYRLQLGSFSQTRKFMLLR